MLEASCCHSAAPRGSKTVALGGTQPVDNQWITSEYQATPARLIWSKLQLDHWLEVLRCMGEVVNCTASCVLVFMEKSM